ncbi:hypothetical protein J2Z65_002371 [Paenibacillus aceris]|uniref:Uncharacterized protein n=1 Tax=Paenibacillus aceris TaxID=869555 RepID=A0ABS4HXE1_9BACL|nr:hypothetical protein [Paenibacillus aceris]
MDCPFSTKKIANSMLILQYSWQFLLIIRTQLSLQSFDHIARFSEIMIIGGANDTLRQIFKIYDSITWLLQAVNNKNNSPQN